ncbi:MAG: NUMOD3 domain-containing DNA-binding protein [Desulfuromonadaceae bacterium]
MKIIYKTTNLINGKIYIGKACNKRAMNTSYLGSGTIYNRAEKKYGKENFKREIIDIAESRKEQCLKEIFWIDFYDARNPTIGYNVAPGGQGGATRSGMKNSENTRQKIRVALAGRKCPEQSARMTGENHPFYGKSRPEHSQRMQGENNPMFGKKNPGASKWWKEYWKNKKSI